MLLERLKYPIPSPRRCFGMISVAIVLAAVLAMPHPRPCRNRTRISAHTLCAHKKARGISAIRPTPASKTPFRPSLSSIIPETGRMSREETVTAPVTQPRIASAPPKLLAYSGRVGSNIWKPQNRSRLIPVIKINAFVQSGCFSMEDAFL